ncbi:hypothetical protein [Methylobacterium haplocladii]|uniref:Uncharacterized protein n=1 Tax=Methylobacterium haplocladii TaxID=1176176 RepID=A0A512IPA9_9HYPH|nr:hypothetical protein [Methylobacterium haplocladii]GEO99502.1 hypothetical protein MHA02_18900 [Methylobacterium haplocladii]GJD84555.1 hypothetical protein HPGCJGGD_2433 [Methylobacterium haplocladii]GLS59760.1 hypothetical protein GCM10007887_24320 [Methylobacterium haplocladii]
MSVEQNFRELESNIQRYITTESADHEKKALLACLVAIAKDMAERANKEREEKLTKP